MHIGFVITQVRTEILTPQVKLKEYGTELIEVADDGTGVSRADLASLTLKHHTSKFTSIDDLQVSSNEQERLHCLG